MEPAALKWKTIGLAVRSTHYNWVGGEHDGYIGWYPVCKVGCDLLLCTLVFLFPTSVLVFQLSVFIWHRLQVEVFVLGLLPTTYDTEYTGSRLIIEIKQSWACPVLGWVIAIEPQVLQALFAFTFFFPYQTNLQSRLWFVAFAHLTECGNSIFVCTECKWTVLKFWAILHNDPSQPLSVY